MNFLDGYIYLLSTSSFQLPFFTTPESYPNCYGFTDHRYLLMEILKNTLQKHSQHCFLYI